jgi:hypothetical protein
MLSPGVNVTEIDLTGIVPAVATSDAAIAGVFNWGPMNIRYLVNNESILVTKFGKPNSNNAETFFTAANFLSYGNRLYVTRVANTTDAVAGTLSAVANTGAVGNLVSQVVLNGNNYGSQPYDANVFWTARYAGAVGNSLKISICDSVNAYSSSLKMGGLTATETIDVSANLSVGIGQNYANLVVTPGAGGTALNCNTYINNLVANLTIGDYLSVGNVTIGTQQLRITNISSIISNSTGGFATLTFDSTYRLATAFTTNTSVNSTVTRYWEYYTVFNGAPVQTAYTAQFGNTSAVDGIHVVVADKNGTFTGIPGTVLETYQNLSRGTDAKTVAGQSNYYKTVINTSSDYVWYQQDRAGAVSNTVANIATSSNKTPFTLQFQAGQDGASEGAIALSVVTAGYDYYKSAEDVDVSLILQGKPIGTGGSYQLANYIIDNICETRKDCIVLITPDDSVVTNNPGLEALSIVGWRNLVHDSSYAVLDSGYKYMYDRYNDVYRYIPTNGDVAGLCARTDTNRDPWWSPAGFNRGQIKNLLRLRWNPKQADRDILYKNGVNPLVSFPGQGTILYGDKTLQSKPSAFDRINVRRLFIVLEKAIATASKFFLFEFNDEFTRAQFKSLVTPYLRDIQGRRGITDFLVVCDSTNNTGQRIDANEFWGDIYIKPARSINFIQLNFVAVATGVQFSEIVGKF